MDLEDFIKMINVEVVINHPPLHFKLVNGVVFVYGCLKWLVRNSNEVLCKMRCGNV